MLGHKAFRGDDQRTRPAALPLGLIALLFTMTMASVRAEKAWMLDTKFDRPEQISLELTFEPEKNYWYMPYEVTNNTGRDRYLFLKIWLVVNGDEENRTYQDHLFPSLEKAVEVAHERKYHNRVELMGKLKDGETRRGIALFGSIGYGIKTVDVYVGGLAKNTLTRNEDGDPYFLTRRLKTHYIRLGDPESDPYTVLIRKRDETLFIEERIPVEGSENAAAKDPDAGDAEEPRTEEVVEDGAAGDDTPAEAAPAEEAPTEEAPAEEAPTEEAPPASSEAETEEEKAPDFRPDE